MKTVRNPIILLDYDKRKLAKPLEPMVDEQMHDLFVRNSDGITNTSLYESYRQRLMEDEYIVNVDIDHTTQNTHFGFDIDLNSSDTDVTYALDCESFQPISFSVDGTAEYGSWYRFMEDVFCIRPCLFKDGQVVYYLRPDNYNFTDDEEPVDIRSGDLGDVMIELKQTFYKFEIVNNILKFRVANYKVDETYYSDAFVEYNEGSVINDRMYISAYDNTLINDTLMSVSGADVTDILVNSVEECRTKCSAKGKGYGQMVSAKYLYLLAITCLFLKTRNLSTFIRNHNPSTTGLMDREGLFFCDGEKHKFLGIDNIFSKTTYLEGFIMANGNLYYKPSGEYTSDKRKYARYPDIGFIQSGWISTAYDVQKRLLIADGVDGTEDMNFGIYYQANTTEGDVIPIANYNHLYLDNDMQAYPKFVFNGGDTIAGVWEDDKPVQRQP